MADFCKDCSENHFGEDYGELAGITTPAAFAELRAAVVICEGCGPIQVDPDGRCVSSDCVIHGKSPEARAFAAGSHVSTDGVKSEKGSRTS